MKIKIKLPDDSERKFDSGMSCYEIAKKINPRFAKEALACVINNQLKDLNTIITSDSELKFLTFKDEEGKKVFWHSSAHILAMAVTKLFPKAKMAIGPAIENGFYYDFLVNKPFTKEDLKKIEGEMKEIIKQKIPFERKEVSKKKAQELFKNNEFKLELIKELKVKPSLYYNNKFVDLCRGPHVPHTGYVKAVKLLSTSSAYWKGRSDGKVLMRIYGISFPKKKMLDEYLKFLEEVEKRNHIKLGKQLKLYSFHPEAPGMPFFRNNGVLLMNNIMKYWQEEHDKLNYRIIMTPQILSADLWVRSGHSKHYKENMYYLEIDDKEYAVKPMNCPGGMLVYKEDSHSYKEFPLKVAEIGVVHRHELSGVLSGLFRVRRFTQDDAHIFMTEEQIVPVIKETVNLIIRMYKTFGVPLDHVEISTRPEKSIGTDEQWEIATTSLIKALNELGMEYTINEGDGAFYGPKIDFHLKDAIGRTWQCGTIQLDFALPENFDLTYIGDDNKKHRPVMIHRVVLGAIERFMAILVENYAGAFPLWLAPEKTRIIPISDRHKDYAKKIFEELRKKGMHCVLDDSQETVEYRIRKAQLMKVPLMIVIGDKEVKNKTLAVRTRDGKVKFGVKLNELIKEMKEKIEKRINE